MNMRNHTIALGLAGALALGATVSASAGPLPIGTAVKDATSGSLTDVRWRGRGIGPGIAFGLAAGALVGAAVASQPYYGPDYYYGGPVYDPNVYGSGGYPVYVAPGYGGYGYGGYGYGGYGWGQCYTNEGYGRRRPCSAN